MLSYFIISSFSCIVGQVIKILNANTINYNYFNNWSRYSAIKRNREDSRVYYIKIEPTNRLNSYYNHNLFLALVFAKVSITSVKSRLDAVLFSIAISDKCRSRV